MLNLVSEHKTRRIAFHLIFKNLYKKSICLKNMCFFKISALLWYNCICYGFSLNNALNMNKHKLLK